MYKSNPDKTFISSYVYTLYGKMYVLSKLNMWNIQAYATEICMQAIAAD